MEHNQNTYIIKMDTETQCSEDKCRLLHQFMKKRFSQKRTVLAVVDRLFSQLGMHFNGRCRCREVAVVERFKQELMYGLSAGTKKCGRCREVAVVERWPLVEVRLYLSFG